MITERFIIIGNIFVLFYNGFQPVLFKTELKYNTIFRTINHFVKTVLKTFWNQGSTGYVHSVKCELLDLRCTTGHRYDGGVSAYLDAVIDMISTRGIPAPASVSSQTTFQVNSGSHSIVGLPVVRQIDIDKVSNTFDALKERMDFSGPRIFSKGDNYLEYCKKMSEDQNFIMDRGFSSGNKPVFVNANSIEGVWISQSEYGNPNSFWSRNGRYENGLSSLAKIANSLPQLQSCLSAGNVSEFSSGALADCMRVYGREPVKVNIIEMPNGKCFYEFQEDGRHRVLVAQMLNVDIPVQVTGKQIYKSKKWADNLL